MPAGSALPTNKDINFLPHIALKNMSPVFGLSHSSKVSGMIACVGFAEIVSSFAAMIRDMYECW